MEGWRDGGGELRRLLRLVMAGLSALFTCNVCIGW